LLPSRGGGTAEAWLAKSRPDDADWEGRWARDLSARATPRRDRDLRGVGRPSRPHAGGRPRPWPRCCR
jgi:hypothetical protein